MTLLQNDSSLMKDPCQSRWLNEPGLNGFTLHHISGCNSIKEVWGCDENCRVYFLLAGDTWDLYGCLEMFHNFMYFTGCCRAALAEVNYGLLCDLIGTEEEEGGRRKLRRSRVERVTEACFHSFAAVKWRSRWLRLPLWALLAGFHYVVLLAIVDCKT